MARSYLIGSWNDADTYDYSGEMLMGNRNGKSVCMDHMIGDKANLARYADPEVIKPKPKKKASDSIDLANKHLERMEKLGQDLDNEYLNGEIDKERYDYLRYKLDLRLVKAWERVEKESADYWRKEDESLSFDLSAISLNHTNVLGKRENASSSVFSLFKAGIQAIPEAVCKNSAKEVENNFIEDAKMFLLFSLIGASILLIASH